MLDLDLRGWPAAGVLTGVETKAFEHEWADPLVIRTPLRLIHQIVAFPPPVATATQVTENGSRILRIRMFSCTIDVVPWRDEKIAVFAAGQQVASVLFF